MVTQLTNSKIRPEHQARQAIIYVRQSSLMQVREHTASTARQYDLTGRAKALGWPQEQILVIDQDLGRSGATLVGRDGFQLLIAEVSLGHAGAVLSLEASRLARCCSDWYRLIEICALTKTLVIDEDGVYDPTNYNDRLLLGFKGAMSEAELHWLRSRLLGGKLEKAQHAQLRFCPATGYILNQAGKIVLDPDEEIRHCLELVFQIFDQQGSALAVVKYFAKHNLRIPTRLWGKAKDGEVIWQVLKHGRVLAILHNPIYAGLYVFGRTKTSNKPVVGEPNRIKGRTYQIKQKDWAFVFHNNHPGYISWDQFMRNQQKLSDNCTWPENRRGAVRAGFALLQGIVLCGKCGRRMNVRYLKDGITPCYDCCQTHKQLGLPVCQTITGAGIDKAVANLFLEAMQPAQLEVSMATINGIEEQARQVDKQWQLRLERVRYEAQLARRRFIVVDPENRLVARNLEKEWNDKLVEIERLEREYASLPSISTQLISAQERQQILALAQDLPAIWNSAITSNSQRKQLLRLIIKDITLLRCDKTIAISIRWQTDACTTIEISRPKPPGDIRRTDPKVVDRICELTPNHTEREIVDILNQEGFKSGTNNGPFTRSKVQWICYAYGIEKSCPALPSAYENGKRSDGRYCAETAAQLLNVDVSTIARWCRNGQLDGVQSVFDGPWWIKLTPEIISQMRKPKRRRWSRNSSK